MIKGVLTQREKGIRGEDSIVFSCESLGREVLANCYRLQRRIEAEAIVGGGAKVKRAFGFETPTIFEFGARNPGKGRCFLMCLIRVYCIVLYYDQIA